MAAKEISNTIKISVAVLFLLAFLYIVNPPAQAPLGIYIIFLGISIVVYYLKPFQKTLTGFSKTNAGRSVLLALILGVVYYFATKMIPGFSLGLPLLPNTIGDSLKFFIVVIVAPIVETIVFQGALMGYVRSYSNSKRQTIIAILVQAVVFSLFHLAAYISGFYSLPNFAAGLSAISANLSAFLAAFIFALIAGMIVINNSIKNLLFAAVLHFILNLIVFTSFSVVFA